MMYHAEIAIAAFLLLLPFPRAASAQTPSSSPSPQSGAPAPGTIIDAGNVAAYTKYLPSAAEMAVRHGLAIRVVPTKRLDWSAGFTHATEKYASQVGLDKDDYITNYIAGAPFPTVDLSDPKAAVKIAYNWHMGPFMPDDFSLRPWGSYAYSDAGGPNGVVPEDDAAFSCDQFTFLRFAHRTEVDPRPALTNNADGFEWKARCNAWTQLAMGGSGEGAGIWLRFMDPRRGDEFYGLDTRTRRLRRQASFDALDQNCRSCHQPYWAYALPKTEEFTYRLLGTTSLLACLTSANEPAGLAARDRSFTLTQEPFEIRSAYILEMTSNLPGYSNLRSLVFIDTEAYVWLAAEFYNGNERTEVAIPLWHSHPSPSGGNLFELAGEFYVPLVKTPQAVNHASANERPGNAKWFFRTLVPAHEVFDQKINTGELSDAAFNPQAMSR